MTDHRKTAVYIRLSAEDDNVDGRAKKESDSVTSQRILLKSFVIDQLGVDEADILEYVDDGVSGTHFKRQGFQQLQDDMKSGEIGCVVVKDFSRFGRDYLEVGFYIEYIFPLLQIRFISINDSYDSAASSGMTGGMNVALQNLVSVPSAVALPQYSSVSCRLNGERCRLQVTLACSPPWLASFLSAIHDVADPVAMSIMSVRLLPQPFQNVSRALTKFDLCVSIQGISSMNMTFFRSEGNVSR